MKSRIYNRTSLIYYTSRCLCFRGPSAVGWGGALGLFAVFMTSNWIAEPYLRKVPIYNRKYTNAYKYDNMYGS